ncbi:MAG: hypothetical protein ACE5FH_08155 [Candidatus Zixiibacteriota bacterium]
MKKSFGHLAVLLLGLTLIAYSPRAESQTVTTMQPLFDDSDAPRISGVDTPGSGADLDLDGISPSIGDLTLYETYFIYGLSVFIHSLDGQVAASDYNCDSLALSVADLNTLMQLVAAGATPCFPISRQTTDISDPVVASNATVGEPYEISIDHLELTSFQNTGWVDLRITGGTEPFVGFQFTLDYDTAGLQLLDAEIGQAYSDWGGFAYFESTVGGQTRLCLVGSAIKAGPVPNLSPHPAPVTLVRLQFQLSDTLQGSSHDINFVWETCGDNVIVVNDTTVSTLGTPSYLALSADVYDADNVLITDTSSQFSGATASCLAGGGGAVPQRFAGFRSGRITRTQCCVGIRGDVNYDGVNADIVDLTYLVELLFVGDFVICMEEADLNASGGNFPDVVDLTYLVDYLFASGPAPEPCPQPFD